jgi:hypothetical protein
MIEIGGVFICASMMLSSSGQRRQRALLSSRALSRSSVAFVPFMSRK